MLLACFGYHKPPKEPISWDENQCLVSLRKTFGAMKTSVFSSSGWGPLLLPPLVPKRGSWNAFVSLRSYDLPPYESWMGFGMWRIGPKRWSRGVRRNRLYLFVSSLFFLPPSFSVLLGEFDVFFSLFCF